jgi:predicted SprT family Zn-dependent metalloprotease
MRKSIIISPEQELARDERIRRIIAECEAKIEQEYQDHMYNPIYGDPAKQLMRFAKKTFRQYDLKGWKLGFLKYEGRRNGNCNVQTKRITIDFDVLPKFTVDRLSGLFLHEVAHALCVKEDANKTGKGYEREPHGKDFRKMCRRINVPKEFWTATIVMDS